MNNLREYSRRRINLRRNYSSKNFSTLSNIGLGHQGVVTKTGIIQSFRTNEVEYGLTINELLAGLMNSTGTTECISYESKPITKFLSYSEVASDTPFQWYALEDKQFKHIRGVI